MQEQVDKLNRSSSGASEGHWRYIEGHGIVWELAAKDRMGKEPTPPTDRPSPLLEDLVKWGKSIDFDNLKENSVVMIKIGIEDPVYSSKMQHGVIHQVLEPRINILKQKKITVLFTSLDDDISSLSPDDMEKAGWVKKDKPLIISSVR